MEDTLSDALDSQFGDDSSAVVEDSVGFTQDAGDTIWDAADTAAPEVAADPDDPTTTEEQEQPGAEAKAAETPNPVAKAVKQLTFKAGDKAVPLSEDAKIEWKVDGKTETPTVKELLNNYAGKQSWERKFNEVANQRKQAVNDINEFQAVRQRHSALITDMHEKAAKGQVFEAVQSMIDMTGQGGKIDAREYVRNLRNALMKQAQELSALSPEQREIYETKEEQAYTKSRYEKVLAEREQEKNQRNYTERVNTAIQASGSTAEEYTKVRDYLLEHGPKNGLKPQDLTPEYIRDNIRNVRDYRSAKEAIEAVDPNLMKNEKVWDHAVYLLRQNPDWTQEDLKEVFKTAVASNRTQTVSKKVGKSPVATVATAGVVAASNKKATAAKKAKSAPGAFGEFTADDLDW